MAANLLYRIEYMAPNSSQGLFIHGYADNDFVAYSTVVYFIGGPGAVGHVQLTQGETYRHVDGTVAHEIYVQNLAPDNPCAVDVIQLVESYPL